MGWPFKEEKKEVAPIITEKVVMPDMSKYATAESLDLLRKEIASSNLYLNKEVASQFLNITKAIEELKRVKIEEKPKESFNFLKGSSDDKYMAGLDRGVDIGIQMASKIDAKMIAKVRNEAIDEILRSKNGSHKTNN